MFKTDVSILKNAKPSTFRPIDVVELKLTLYKSMIMPEFAKGIRFPAPFSIPSIF